MQIDADKKSRQSLVIDSATRQINTYLTSSAACGYSFATGVNLNNGDSLEIKDKNDQTKFKATDKIGENTTIKSINVVPPTNNTINETRYPFKVMVIFEKKINGLKVPTKRSLSVIGNIDGSGNISNCISYETTAIADGIARACTGIGGTYNTTSGECDPTVANTAPGSSCEEVKTGTIRYNTVIGGIEFCNNQTPPVWQQTGSGANGSIFQLKDMNAYYSTGKVGIGTDGPKSNLHIFKARAVDNPVENEDSLLTLENNDNAYLTFKTPRNKEQGIRFEAPLLGGNGEQGGGIFYKEASLHFRSEDLSRSNMILTYAGRLGIGKDIVTPQAGLHVTSANNSSSTDRGAMMGSTDANASIELKTQGSGSGTSHIDFGHAGDDYDGRIIYSNLHDRMEFYTNSNYAMGIEDNGYVAIGPSRFIPSHILHIKGVARSAQASWATSSDARVKENILGLPDGLEKIMALRPVHYNYIDEYIASRPALAGLKTGFIAQEVAIVDPTMVNYIKEKVGNEEIEDFNILSIDNMIPLLVGATQTQQLQIVKNLEMFKKMHTGLAERVSTSEEEIKLLMIKNHKILEEIKRLTKVVNELINKVK